MKKEELQVLLKNYADGSCTEDEKAIIESWYNQYSEDVEIPGERAREAAKRLVYLNLPKHGYKLNRTAIMLAVAAVTIGLLIAFFITYVHLNTPKPNESIFSAIVPGANKAFLIANSGQKFDLSGATTGNLVKNAGVVINKTHAAQIVFSFIKGNTDDHTPYTITTPNGGQWQVKLSDGTIIKMNSGSSITFPATFRKFGDRIVSLQGEAYFEVAKDAHHPFIVLSGKQRVEVLGTHFNINSYTDEPTIKTTLLEGKVKVSVLGNKVSHFLKPGEQAEANSKEITVARVNVNEVIAWKEGYFLFDNEPVENVMRKLARWYNVKVEYEGQIPSDGLTGRISRTKDIKQVIDAIQATGTIHLKVEGRRIIVMR